MLFAKKSEKLFTKIEFVNALTQKEISSLNDRYLSLGLNIKQIIVDNYGNEIYSEKCSSSELLGKKRSRKNFDSWQDFLLRYYGEDEINKSSKKCKKEEDDKYSKKELLELKNSLNSLKEECKKIEYKICKIETNEFKAKVIDYILKYKKYLRKEDYSYLFNKWKNELSKIKGIDVLNFSNMNDLYNWKVPILKAFKSEIILYAVSNIFESKINGKRSVIEKQSEDKNNIFLEEEEEEKKNNLSASDSYSSENFNDFNFFNKNQGQFLKDIDKDEEF